MPDTKEEPWVCSVEAEELGRLCLSATASGYHVELSPAHKGGPYYAMLCMRDPTGFPVRVTAFAPTPGRALKAALLEIELVTAVPEEETGEPLAEGAG